MAIAILAYMVLILGASLGYKWFAKPKSNKFTMPARPDTIAACMGYVSGSAMIHEFEGLAMVPQKRRNRLICEMARRYAVRRVAGSCNPKSTKMPMPARFVVDFEGSGETRLDSYREIGVDVAAM